MTGRRGVFCAVLVGGLIGFAAAAHAYVGPGAGLSALGSLVALLGTVAVAILGFIWFPVKRLLKALRKPKQASTTTDAQTSSLQGKTEPESAPSAPAPSKQ
jgi:hypothetical protein